MKEFSDDPLAEPYPNRPCVAVGAVVFKDDRVLLVRRGQPPAQNLWAIPGGKVDLGETLQAAAEREILEETGIIIRARHPIYTFDLLEKASNGNIRFHYVIVDLIADYIAGEICAGDDATEARWVGPEEVQQLAVNAKTVSLLRREFGFGSTVPGGD